METGRIAYKMPCSKDPVEIKILVRSDKALGDSRATIQRLPWQAQEALQPVSTLR